MDFDLTPAQIDLVRRAREAGAEWRDHAEEWDISNKAPIDEVTKRMGELGFLGLTIPKEYGGQGLSNLDYALAVEEITRTATTWIAAEPLFRTSGAGPTICMQSTNEVARDKFLPRIVSGSDGCTIGITEPDHGSDMTSLETTAVLDGDDVILNGHKHYITGAIEDSLYVTFVRFDGIRGAGGIGAVMVERGTPGFEMEHGPDFVGSRGIPHGELHFDDCRVPAENIMFRPGEFGRLMTAFNMERLHNASSCLGSAEAAFDETVRYTESRRQFDRDIIEFQSIYHQVADMWTSIEACRYLVYKAACSSVDGKFPRPLDVTVAKHFSNQVMYDLSGTAVLLHGGHGTEIGVAVQRIHRDSLVCRIAGGSPHMVRNTIAGQLLPHRKFSQRPPSPPAPAADHPPMVDSRQGG
jgi:butyryl-CoA dehydrogenase